jgi:hypothetical protein
MGTHGCQLVNGAEAPQSAFSVDCVPSGRCRTEPDQRVASAPDSMGNETVTTIAGAAELREPVAR